MFNTMVVVWGVSVVTSRKTLVDFFVTVGGTTVVI